jgi:hypothetical protein
MPKASHISWISTWWMQSSSQRCHGMMKPSGGTITRCWTLIMLPGCRLSSVLMQMTRKAISPKRITVPVASDSTPWDCSWLQPNVPLVGPYSSRKDQPRLYRSWPTIAARSLWLPDPDMAAGMLQ